jgi:hypothetical protein
MEFQAPAGLLLVIAAMICGVPIGIVILIIEYKKWRITTLGSGPASPFRSSPAQPSEEPPTPGPSSAAAAEEETVERARQRWLDSVRQEREAQRRWLAVQEELDRHSPFRNPPAS